MADDVVAADADDPLHEVATGRVEPDLGQRSLETVEGHVAGPAELIGEEPQYSRLAARLLAGYLDKEVRGQGVASFSQSIRYAYDQGLISDGTAAFVARTQ